MKTYLLILAMILATGVALVAQPMGREGRRDQMRSDWHESLQLTDTQEQQVEAMWVSFNKTAQPLRNQLDEKRAALKSLTTVDNPDKKKIEATVSEIGKLETSLLQARINHRQEVRVILDDSQKVRFDQHGDRIMRGRFDDGKHHGCPYR